MFRNSIQGSGLGRSDMIDFLVVLGGGEFHVAFLEGIDRVVFSETDVLAGSGLGTALAEDDVAGNHVFTADFLDAESFAFRFTAVL